MNELRQLLGIVSTFAIIELIRWRFRSRRKGQDVGISRLYLVIAIIALAWLFVIGGIDC